MKITSTETTTRYYVQDDERPRRDRYGRIGYPSYRVVHSKRTGNHPYENWEVVSFKGYNNVEHWCDKEKPTYKRILAKTQALLDAFEPKELGETLNDHPAGVAG